MGSLLKALSVLSRRLAWGAAVACVLALAPAPLLADESNGGQESTSLSVKEAAALQRGLHLPGPRVGRRTPTAADAPAGRSINQTQASAGPQVHACHRWVIRTRRVQPPAQDDPARA